MGWPSQADFILCFQRSLGMGMKERREPFTLVFSHEGYYIIQVNNHIVKALKDLSYFELEEIAQGIDKTIDSYQIEEKRETKKVKPGRHAYSTPVLTKNKKLSELKTSLRKVTFEKALKKLKNKTKYSSLCKKNDIPVFFIHFVPYNDEYNSRKKLNENKLRGGKSLLVRKSVMMM